uniref:Sex hormone-binding globulin n=1 Tax=Suricata suricatta TaxID=37032 RepID=A0A673V2Y2_SURSU
MTFDFTKIRKTSSSFELQTWDPEGVIFYGDTDPQEDWFMLGLRDGRPEIQMHNRLAQLTVGAGPRLDDGRWHQLVPALDGCLRRDSWLDQQAQASVSTLSSSLRSCSVESQPGTFFPPGARAEFSLRDLPQPHAEPWAFSLDLGLQLAAGSGRLLALGSPENPPWLSLQLQDQKVILSSASGPPLHLPLVLGPHLQLKLTTSGVILSQGPEKEILALPLLGPGSLLNLWGQPQGRLFLGALPGEAALASFCLDGLWAQGQKLDMDQALSRSQNIWTHSCPRSLGNDTNTTH